MELKEEHNNMFTISDYIFNSDNSKDDLFLAKEKALAKALNSLSNKQREILYLHYIKELSHKEISIIMDINEQSSKNLLSRTLTKLRSLFKIICSLIL